jgi:hypothetical protein
VTSLGIEAEGVSGYRPRGDKFEGIEWITLK